MTNASEETFDTFLKNLQTKPHWQWTANPSAICKNFWNSFDICKVRSRLLILRHDRHVYVNHRISTGKYGIPFMYSNLVHIHYYRVVYGSGEPILTEVNLNWGMNNCTVFCGENYSPIFKLKRRFNLITVKVSAWMTNYTPPLMLTHLLMHILISRLLLLISVNWRVPLWFYVNNRMDMFCLT